MFVPNGRILQLDAYRRLLEVPTCLGAKHSSLSRPLEWARLRIRDEVRPGFLVLTGNDLAIDIVILSELLLLASDERNLSDGISKGRLTSTVESILDECGLVRGRRRRSAPAGAGPWRCGRLGFDVL